MQSHYMKALEAERLASLAREAEEERAERERAAAATRERLKPLEIRLANLLRTIPLEVQREGLSLAQVQRLLAGRGRGRHCSAAELGAAFRANGFDRIRRWKGPVFEAVWVKQN